MHSFPKSQMTNLQSGNCAVADESLVGDFVPGIHSPLFELDLDLTRTFSKDPIPGDIDSTEFTPIPSLAEPNQDWFELALQTEPVARPPVRNSWGDDEEEVEEEIPDDDPDDDEPDPFEDFDEDDFDDDFDDDFEEELEDEYEIEPADDGMVTDADDGEISEDELIDEDEEESPDLDDEPLDE